MALPAGGLAGPFPPAPCDWPGAETLEGRRLAGFTDSESNPPAVRIQTVTEKSCLSAAAVPCYFVIWRNILMQQFMAITKALSDPSRVRILLALRKGELCVCQITELFGFAPSTISKHLSILHQGGLILSRKSERWVYYRLPDRSAPVAVRQALGWVHKSLAKTVEAAADGKKLNQILKTDLAVICRRQRCC